jgi:hypothetical protein
MNDPRHRDERARRGIRWTVIVLVLIAVGLYIATFVRQVP